MKIKTLLSEETTRSVSTKFGKLDVKPIRRDDDFRDLIHNKFTSVPIFIVDLKCSINLSSL